MGANEVKVIDDIDIANTLINTLMKSSLKFGTDLYNGYCSGNVSSFKRIEDNRFSMFTKDNNGEYIFKFKSLLLYIPNLDNELSPIIFFEEQTSKKHLRTLPLV